MLLNDWLNDWCALLATFSPFLPEKTFYLWSLIFFILRISIMYMGGLDQAEFGWIVFREGKISKVRIVWCKKGVRIVWLRSSYIKSFIKKQKPRENFSKKFWKSLKQYQIDKTRKSKWREKLNGTKPENPDNFCKIKKILKKIKKKINFFAKFWTWNEEILKEEIYTHKRHWTFGMKRFQKENFFDEKQNWKKIKKRKTFKTRKILKHKINFGT